MEDEGVISISLKSGGSLCESLKYENRTVFRTLPGKEFEIVVHILKPELLNSMQMLGRKYVYYTVNI